MVSPFDYVELLLQTCQHTLCFYLLVGSVSNLSSPNLKYILICLKVQAPPSFAMSSAELSSKSPHLGQLLQILTGFRAQWRLKDCRGQNKFKFIATFAAISYLA